MKFNVFTYYTPTINLRSLLQIYTASPRFPIKMSDKKPQIIIKTNVDESRDKLYQEKKFLEEVVNFNFLLNKLKNDEIKITSLLNLQTYNEKDVEYLKDKLKKDYQYLMGLKKKIEDQNQ